MGIKTFHAKAPTRIDLAGGTLDIWPLYLLLKDPITLNLGIDLFAEAHLEVESAVAGNHRAQILLKSEDQGIQLETSWDDLFNGTQKPHPALELHWKLLSYFIRNELKSDIPKDSRVSLKTKARSPAGAGLGGSSALSVSIIGALWSWVKDLRQGTPDFKNEGEKLIEIVRDIETTVIRVPAGLQDYYGAMFGGLQCLRWGTGSHTREVLSPSLIPGLEKRTLLFYSGQSRNSGINNWALFKDFVDGQNNVQSRFQGIATATLHLKKALEQENWAGVGEAIAEEWKIRKTLASGITTPDIDAAFEEAKQIAPVSGKVCGAGGGGCFFVYLPDLAQNGSELRSKIQEVFQARGIRSLPFSGVPKGLEVQFSRA